MAVRSGSGLSPLSADQQHSDDAVPGGGCTGLRHHRKFPLLLPLGPPKGAAQCCCCWDCSPKGAVSSRPRLPEAMPKRFRCVSPALGCGGDSGVAPLLRLAAIEPALPLVRSIGSAARSLACCRLSAADLKRLLAWSTVSQTGLVVLYPQPVVPCPDPRAGQHPVFTAGGSGTARGMWHGCAAKRVTPPPVHSQSPACQGWPALPPKNSGANSTCGP